MQFSKDSIIGLFIGLFFIAGIAYVMNSPTLLTSAEPARQMPQVDINPRGGLDEIRFADLQIEAVFIDMERYLGWYPDDKKRIKHAAEKAVLELKAVKDFLNQLILPDNLAELKEEQIELIVALSNAYNRIESKSPDQVEGALSPIFSLYSNYYGKMLKTLEKADLTIDPLEGCNPIQEQTRYTADENDRQLYWTAVEQIAGGNYTAAYDMLLPVQKKYENTIFGTCIDFRLACCLVRAESSEQAVEILAGIIDSQSYCPVLYDAFIHYRTQTQALKYGMSNYSDIPNWDYNLMRWNAIQTIRRYLIEKPEDMWAQHQANELLTLPNIGCGGSFGNDNITYWLELYGAE